MTTKELRKRWRGNRRYTLKFVEAVPETSLGFKPVDGTKTYASQLSHLTTWLRTHSRFVTEHEFEKVRPKTTADFQRYLTEFFDRIDHYLETATEAELDQSVKVWYGTVSKQFILATMENHLAHHRGQLVVYLRLLGVTPPSYVGW